MSTVSISGCDLPGLADDLHFDDPDLSNGGRSLASTASVAGSTSVGVEASLVDRKLFLIGFFPLPLFLRRIRFSRVSWRSTSWSHAVPATLIFRNFIEL